jgi:hypothetical protein
VTLTWNRKKIAIEKGIMEEITIFVKTDKGNTLELKVSEGTSIEGLKNIVEKQHDIYKYQQKWYLDSIQLKDNYIPTNEITLILCISDPIYCMYCNKERDVVFAMEYGYYCKKCLYGIGELQGRFINSNIITDEITLKYCTIHGYQFDCYCIDCSLDVCKKCNKHENCNTLLKTSKEYMSISLRMKSKNDFIRNYNKTNKNVIKSINDKIKELERIKKELSSDETFKYINSDYIYKLKDFYKQENIDKIIDKIEGDVLFIIKNDEDLSNIDLSTFSTIILSFYKEIKRNIMIEGDLEGSGLELSMIICTLLLKDLMTLRISSYSFMEYVSFIIESLGPMPKRNLELFLNVIIKYKNLGFY